MATNSRNLPCIGQIQQMIKVLDFIQLTGIPDHTPAAIITLDGLIGAGKSTFLDDLDSFSRKFFVSPEPVDAWAQELKEFYENPDANAFQLQLKIIRSLRKRMEAVFSNPQIKGKIVVFERSAASCRMFIEMSKHKFTTEELKMLEEEIDFDETILAALPTKCPHFRAFMDGTVDICMERIAERKRPGEDQITKEYLYKLQEQQFLTFKRANDADFLSHIKTGFIGLRHLCSPFFVPSLTENGRKDRVEEFKQHVKFITQAYYLTTQLHRFR